MKISVGYIKETKLYKVSIRYKKHFVEILHETYEGAFALATFKMRLNLTKVFNEKFL